MNYRSLYLLCLMLFLAACSNTENSQSTEAEEAAATPTPEMNWEPLFTGELTDADYPEGVWTIENGELTASEDEVIWTTKEYDNFELELEFKNAPGTNSGVIVYCTNKEDWIPHSVEIQIADDYADQWAESPKDWQCGAIFGHLPADQQKVVKEPGQWNSYTITCIDKNIKVILNGREVTNMDMSQWTSATTNPDGSPIPEWLSTPFAELPTKGYIGLQGKHAGAPIWFRKIRVREL